MISEFLHIGRGVRSGNPGARVGGAALEEARRLGARRLESDVLSEKAKLALALGDLGTARRHMMASLALANDLGLGLRQTHGLVVLGAIHLRSGAHALGKAYLRNARRLAEEQEYWLRAREAESLLRA